MAQKGNFRVISQPSSSRERTRPLSVNPELFWTFVAPLRRGFAYDAKSTTARNNRRVSMSKNQSKNGGGENTSSSRSKGKFTGSPVVKELKNLIVIILKDKKG